jgi:predicted Fe-S protein YdhL (DUF1289 family)
MSMQQNLQHFDPLKHTGPLPTPCIGICQMDSVSALCKGCFRTMDEIIDWSVASESKKFTIWQEIKRRRTPA